MNIGIVGHEAAKFTPAAEQRARQIIRDLLVDPDAACVSGECHLGGVDIFAKEEALALGRRYIPFPPKSKNWTDGYKPRNMLIAEHSDVTHVIVVAAYPEDYSGIQFKFCYHCGTDAHIKSGGCWTGQYALRLGKRALWHVL